jgi:hypothetical protein
MGKRLRKKVTVKGIKRLKDRLKKTRYRLRLL